jgi:hypothetical protein
MAEKDFHISEKYNFRHALKIWLIMATNKKEKKFDAVKMMRDIREKISAETQNMTFDELKAYIKKKLAENNSIPVGQQ